MLLTFKVSYPSKTTVVLFAVCGPQYTRTPLQGPRRHNIKQVIILTTMGGPRKFLEMHINYVSKKWQEFDKGDFESGWNVSDVPIPGGAVTSSSKNKLHEWYDQVSGGTGWEDVTKKIFVTNVKNLAKRYMNGPNGVRHRAALAAAQTAAAANSTDELEEMSGGESESNQGHVESEDEENEITLASVQCVYKVAKQGETETEKVFIIIQAPSGWYISQEQFKRDFILLINNGNTLRLSFTGTEALFNKDTARNVLEEQEAFNGIYAPINGVQNVAVTAMKSAIMDQMINDEVPSFIFDVPLIKKCTSISPIEGLIRKTTDRGVPVTEPVPAVSLSCLFDFKEVCSELFFPHRNAQ